MSGVDGTTLAKLDTAMDLVRAEVITALGTFAAFNSGHEGKAVIEEELEELWEHVKANRFYSYEAHMEAKQIAAMAVRYMLDLSGDGTLDVMWKHEFGDTSEPSP